MTLTHRDFCCKTCFTAFCISLNPQGIFQAPVGMECPRFIWDAQMFNFLFFLFRRPQLSETCTADWFDRSFKTAADLASVEADFTKIARSRGLNPTSAEAGLIVHRKLHEFSRRHLGAFASEGIKRDLRRLGLPTTLQKDLKAYFGEMTPKRIRIFLSMFGGRAGFARALAHQEFCECLKTAPNGMPLKLAHFGAYTERSIEEAMASLGIA